MMLMTCLVTQRITDKSVSEFNYWRRFLAVLGYNPAIIESSPQNFPGSAEYFLGSLLTHKADADVESGEWWRLCLMFTGGRERESRRGKNADPGERSLTDFITTGGSPVTRESEQTAALTWANTIKNEKPIKYNMAHIVFTHTKCTFIPKSKILFYLDVCNVHL